MRNKKTFRKFLPGMAVITLGMTSTPLLAELGCPEGFRPDGTELLPDTSFQGGYDSFNSDIPFKADLGDYPTDANISEFSETGISIMTGDYLSDDEIVSQIAFPGDPNPIARVEPAPAVDTWFAFNGNNAGAPTKMWETTLGGLQENTDYAFTAYFSNAMAPGLQAQGYVAPLVSFFANDEKLAEIAVCDAGGGLDPVDRDCLNEASEDAWNRLGATFNTGDATSVTLAVHDGQIITATGNDFAFTLISAQACQPIPEVNDDPEDNDKDGIPDTRDRDDDNDGILDTEEGNGNEDADGDGVINRFDLDSDNDGIPDIIEALGEDEDGRDGLVDNFLDLNKDGYHDPLETTPWSRPDTDGDDTKDYLDLDSDADSETNTPRTDAQEADFIDTDGDGRIDNPIGLAGDGWDDNAEQQIRNNNGVLPNDDDLEGFSNNIPDYRDPLAIEIGTGTIAAGNVETQLEGGLGAVSTLLIPLIGMAAFRRRTRNTVILFAATSLSVALTQVAQAAPGQYYVGAGVGISTLEPRIIQGNPPPTTPLEQTDDSDTGFKLFLGRDMLDWLSIELWGAQLGEAGFNNGGSIDYSIFGGTLVANLPHNSPGVSFLAKLGIANISNSASGNITYEDMEDPQLTGAIGVEYHWQNDISVRGEYEYLDKDAQFISLSVLKRFGGQASPPVTSAPSPEKKTGYTYSNPKPAYIGLPAPPVAINYQETKPIPPKMITLTLEPVYFDTDQYVLKSEGKDKLDSTVALLKTHSNVNVQVVGHTDSRASEQYNYGLAENRVNTVIAYLTSAGIGNSRIESEIRGEMQPAANNNSPEGRALNRRVELIPDPDEVSAPE